MLATQVIRVAAATAMSHDRRQARASTNRHVKWQRLLLRLGSRAASAGCNVKRSRGRGESSLCGASRGVSSSRGSFRELRLLRHTVCMSARCCSVERSGLCSELSRAAASCAAPARSGRAEPKKSAHVEEVDTPAADAKKLPRQELVRLHTNAIEPTHSGGI